MRRKFVQDSENPEFGKKDWKIPRAGRIIRRSVYAFPHAATLGKDQPFMPMTWDVCSVYKELLLNMEFQGRRRYSVNRKALETIIAPSAGGVDPGRTERVMLCKFEKEFSYELPPYYPGKY